MYTLFCVNNMNPTDYEKFYALMAEDRKKEIDRIQLDQDKQLSVCGEMLAKQMISEQLDIPVQDIHFVKDENGKPYAENINIQFNISHSKDYVICAVSETPVGVDIEYIRDIKDSLIQYICTENELRYVHQDKQETMIRFFEIWTAKEAYLKCRGTGIRDLKKIDVLNESIKKQLKTMYFQDYIISIYQD